MHRWYTGLRVAGYAAGAAGAVLFAMGTRHAALRAAGGVLLMVMFAAFLATYVLYIAGTLRRKQGQGAGQGVAKTGGMRG